MISSIEYSSEIPILSDSHQEEKEIISISLINKHKQNEQELNQGINQNNLQSTSSQAIQMDISTNKENNSNCQNLSNVDSEKLHGMNNLSHFPTVKNRESTIQYDSVNSYKDINKNNSITVQQINIADNIKKTSNTFTSIKELGIIKCENQEDANLMKSSSNDDLSTQLVSKKKLYGTINGVILNRQILII